MKTTYISFLILLFSAISLVAQRDETVFGKGGIGLTGVWGGTVNTMSNFDDNYDLSDGGFFVFEINKNFLIGWTGYGSDFTTGNGVEAKITNNDLLLGYAFRSYKSLHPILYLQTGGGKLEIEGEDRDNVFVVQPAVGLETNIFRWFRLGVEGGYRFTTNVDTPSYSDEDLSGAFIGLRLKFGWSWGS